MLDEPLSGQHRLRLGRQSAPGRCYHVTFSTADPQGPLNSEAGRQLVADAMHGMLGRGFRCLEAYAVMPDHVHILFVLDEERMLSATMDGLKTYTAIRINRLAGRSGRLWNQGYYDHCIRCPKDFQNHLNYILGNPVRAGLVEEGEEYQFCRWGPWHALDAEG